MEEKSYNYWLERKNTLKEEFQTNEKSYQYILQSLQSLIESLLLRNGIKAVVKGRVKDFNAFHRKLLLRSQKTNIENPLIFITDIIGLRVVVPFLEDLKTVEACINKSLNIIDTEYKSRYLSVREFGYDSTHIACTIPEDIIEHADLTQDMLIAEIQLRTTLQDAWAEVEHELVYKTSIEKVEDSIRRKLMAINATLTLADITFQEIRDYHNKRYRDVQRRHATLIDKVSTIPEKIDIHATEHDVSERTIDTNHQTFIESLNPDADHDFNDMFIDALDAHVENNFDRAIELYSKLIVISPNHYLYNHRGLVYFALSEYDKAVEDFNMAIELSPNDTRVYTNRGLAYRMLNQYDAALKDFNRSIELNPLWADTFYGRSLTYFDLGNIKAALEDCDKAISLKQDFKQAIRFKQFILNQNH